MKKYLSPIACLVIGFVCGCGVAGYIASKYVETIKAGFPPGYRKFFDEHNDVLMGMTREDVRQYVANARNYEKAVFEKTCKEMDAFALGQVSTVRGIRTSVEANDIEAVKKITSAQVQDFLQAYDDGSYQSSEDWKILADAMAKEFRSEPVSAGDR